MIPHLKYLRSPADCSFPEDGSSLYAQNVGAQKNACEKLLRPTMPPWAALDELPGTRDELPAVPATGLPPPRGGWDTRNPGARGARDAPTSKKKNTQQSYNPPGTTRLPSDEHGPRGDITIRNGAETCEIPLKKRSKYLFL